jgi:NhaP-type Na+/H+ or K+/H+ antiporter
MNVFLLFLIFSLLFFSSLFIQTLRLFELVLSFEFSMLLVVPGLVAIDSQRFQPEPVIFRCGSGLYGAI